MSDRTIHIVSLIAPSPPDYGAAFDLFYKIRAFAAPDYGAAFDLFYKIRAFAALGIRIHLHYFDYNNRHHEGLDDYCATIHRYPRKTGLIGLQPFLPYIVSSRIQKELIRRLSADDHPILLEGIHCTGIIPYLKNKDRKLLIRLHNDEAVYYRRLMHTERRWLRKIYFGIESVLLHRFQQRLPKQIPVAAVSATDQERFQNEYGFRHVSFVPVLIPWQQVHAPEGTGSYCLYHGNLEVAENEQAALWLVEQVFSKSIRPLVIAGKNIPERVKKKATQYAHVRLVASPSDGELQQLIREAQIHVLPSFNSTGLKLKLLHALFAGRFCIANQACVAGSMLEQAVVNAETAEDFLREIENFFSRPFGPEEKEQRRRSLEGYQNARNAELLSTILYSRYP